MRVSALWNLAVRNVWRQRRRNATLIAAIAIAVGGLIVGNALIRGLVADIETDAVELLTGHWKLLPGGWEDDPGVKHAFDPDAAVPRPDSEVVSWTTRLSVPGVVQSERQTRGVQLVGVDPADEQRLSFVGSSEIDGRWLENDEDPGVVLGARLAAELETAAGRRIVVITEHADGRTAEWGGRVVGVYASGNAAANDGLVLTGRSELQRRLGVAGVTELSAFVRNPSNPPEQWTEQPVPGLVLRDWKTLQPMAAAIAGISGGMTSILAVVFVTALAFGMLNTLISAVLERTRELGLLQCLGMQPAWIILQVLFESILLIGLGLALGLTLGFGGLGLIGDGIDLSSFAAGMEMFGGRARMAPVLLTSDVVLVCSMVVVLGLVGTMLPARRAVRMNALEALTGRHRR